MAAAGKFLVVVVEEPGDLPRAFPASYPEFPEGCPRIELLFLKRFWRCSLRVRTSYW